MRTLAPTTSFVLATALASLAALPLIGLFESDAHACGGCFVPPEQNTVVTDHRMILAIGQDATTLYDQIQYQGAPEQFAWVLPITGEAKVGLSADVLFGALDQLTRTQVVAPPLNCPPQPNCGDRAFSPTAGGAQEAADSGVVVNKRETVGPYETVQLSATNPQALATWLDTNGFTVPADVQPVIAQYVKEHFDFLALRLKPGAGVSSMRPVRVTTKGASTVLPLRMVAAGTGPVVGISLWVVGEGRYQPQNMPAFAITDDELTWDWATNSSNYKTLRASKTAATNGRGWEIENSEPRLVSQLTSMVTNGGFGGEGPNAPPDYLPIESNGKITKSASEVRAEDLAALFAGVRGSNARITRLRADLAHAALTEDLVVTATADQSMVSSIRRPKRESSQPQCPIFQGCEQTGTAPRDEAIAHASAQEKANSSCATAPAPRHVEGGVALVGLALAGAAGVAARRRRR